MTLAMYKIQEGIIRTPVNRSHFLSEVTGTELWLKNEFSQFTGSFKERGARYALTSLTAAEKERGVIAASAGNHALALSWHGKQLGIPVTCIMPTRAPLAKINKCQLWANVEIHGEDIGEAKDFAMSNPKFEGMKYINGYDDPEIIAGAGTMGIELFEQIKELDAVVIPIGGAGLIAGVSLALKTLKPDIEIIGVEPDKCMSYAEALRAGEPVSNCLTGITVADGLAVPKVGPHSFEVAKHFVDRVVSVSENEIAMAMLHLVEIESFVVEGGGATGLAALLPGGPLYMDPNLVGKKVAVPLCGGNVDTNVLGRILERGLAQDGRLSRFSATISDRPGGIAELTEVIADIGASIKEIHHERAWLKVSYDQVKVKCVVETTGKEQVDRLRNRLSSVYGPEKVYWYDHTNVD